MKRIKDMSEHEINEYMKAIELINNISNNFAKFAILKLHSSKIKAMQ